jgi:hypothetical protein
MALANPMRTRAPDADVDQPVAERADHRLMPVVSSAALLVEHTPNVRRIPRKVVRTT